jgi:hypothetical protein
VYASQEAESNAKIRQKIASIPIGRGAILRMQVILPYFVMGFLRGIVPHTASFASTKLPDNENTGSSKAQL